MKQCLNMIISGRVQGVGYRWFAREQATIWCIHGYVKNKRNGDVEVLAEGEAHNVTEYLSVLRKGPSFSSVTDIQIQELPFKDHYTKFKVIY